MTNTTIIIMVKNQLERLKLCFKTLLDFVELENLNLVISDFASKDGLEEWAASRTDFTYVYFEEGEATYGKALNDMIRELELKGDILIMTPDFLFTPNCLKVLKEAFTKDTRIEVAGPVSNSFFYPKIVFKNYAEAVFQGMQAKDESVEYALGLDGRVVLVREGSIERNGGFDEKLKSLQEIMLDFMFRVICRDGKVVRCKNSVFWGSLSPYFEEQDKEGDREYLREKWGMDYFNYNPNLNLIQMMDKDYYESMNVLEIGCDCGANLLELKNFYSNAQLYGIEINESATKIASHVVNILQGDIERFECQFDVKFDYIIFGDVLEHLHNPLQTLINCRKLLMDDGCIIACIPNVQHISVVEDLLNGNFTYTDSGLLDKSHIHLFTYKEILSMFEQAGYSVEEIRTQLSGLSDRQRELIGKLVELSSGSTKEMFESFQYIVRGRFVSTQSIYCVM